MNFLISEDEYNRMHSVQRQLNMMARLFGEMTGFEVPCQPEGLAEFFAAQEAALDAVRKAIDDKYQQTIAVDKPMQWFDWMDVVAIASGERRAMHPERLRYIDDALTYLTTLTPEYDLVRRKWAEVSVGYDRQQGDYDPIKASLQQTIYTGNLSATLFANLLDALSGKAVELEQLNETVSQFLAAFDEHHPERAAITQALNAALMHNGYEWVLTCNQGGQHAKWVRKAEATTPDLGTTTTTTDPAVGKQRKRERMAKKAKATTTAHMGATA